MCLLLEAAKSWQQLTKIRYYISAGRKGKLSQFRLEFDNADFPHLAGMQYAQDVDFGLHFSEYYGDKLVPALLSGKMDGSKIEKSRSWEKIKGRLQAIINLQQTLESDFSIALFDPTKSNSKINALLVLFFVALLGVSCEPLERVMDSFPPPHIHGLLSASLAFLLG